jgi:putative hemolysin
MGPVRRRVTVLTGALAAVILTSCTPEAGEPAQDPGVANPAAEFCVERGGTTVIRQDAGGGQQGVCVFPDGSECDEWEYYRGGCTPAEQQ